MMAASGTMSEFGCSSSTISALAVMFALSSLPGLSIDTRTSKLVTLSFSTPIGEICVTRPLNTLSLKVSTRMRAGWPELHAADVGFVDLAANEHLLDVAQRHHERRVGAEVEDRRHRAADLDVAREHGAADRRADRGVGEIFGGAVGRGLGLRDLRARFGHLGLADHELRLRRRACGSPPRRPRCCASSSADCAMRCCSKSDCARS